MPFDLYLLGWDESRDADLADAQLRHQPSRRHEPLTAGRVARVDRNALTVFAAAGPVRARVSGRLFHDAAASDIAGTPTVGDWVVLDDELVVDVLPRRSVFERAVARGEAQAQAIAANIDTVFVVAPLIGRPRPRLVQRCLALAWQSGAQPVVVLTKADLCADVEARADGVRLDAIGADVIAVSAHTRDGLGALDPYLAPGTTFAMVGPSGAGKSTLANTLAGGAAALDTGDVRDDGKGRHTTTARELLVLPRGVVAIDTPGLRGLAMWDADDGIATAFADVEEFAGDCRFADCEHGGEPGCAVRRAIDLGDLSASRLADYEKLQREQRWLVARRDVRARAQERARVKAFSRSIRDQPHR